MIYKKSSRQSYAISLPKNPNTKKKAGNPMNFNPDSLRLYVVTDRSHTDRQTFLTQVESALAGGATCLQLREKNLSEAEFTEEAIGVKAICERYQVPLIINDRLTVALNSCADGIHVGIEDCPVADIRKLTGSDFIIGATAKTVAQARKAEADGANYLGVGAVFPSPTKANAIRITTEDLKQICASVSIPAIAIGGITHTNVSALRGSGIHGIAVVSAVFSAEDIRKATRELKEDALLL